ncbi:MAG: ROK family protein [Candidatus Excrementavichristensenella sp.]|jgi:glucokinase
MIRIGVDLGGTGIKTGAVDEKGNILSRVSRPTRPQRHYEEVIADIAGTARDAAREAGCDWDRIGGVGVGIPGVEDASTGIVPLCANLYWRNVPLRGRLGELLGKEVHVGNDATVAALAEHVAGASRGTENSVLVTLGTGVGTGVILNGKPFSGSHGVATELGHCVIRIDGELCTCGNRGCWERYASATALIREAKNRLLSEDGAVYRAVGGDPEALNAKIVLDCAKSGDPGALALFKEYAYWIALGLANIVSTYDPEIILLGGGVSAAGDFLLRAIQSPYEKAIFFKAMPYAPIGLAALGNDAGIIGAAML